MQLSGESVLDRGNSKCKGPKVETALYSAVSNGEERRREVTAS